MITDALNNQRTHSDASIYEDIDHNGNVVWRQNRILEVRHNLSKWVILTH
jgi:hypothetical protein